MMLLEGCSVFALPPAPEWVPLVGRPEQGKVPNAPPVPAAKQPTAPLISVGQAAPVDPDTILDRVICVVNNDAITLFELDEAEAYYLYESKEQPPSGDARTALRDRLLERIIENRLQLQQAEREKIIVDDAELAEQMTELMKKMNVMIDHFDLIEANEAFAAQAVADGKALGWDWDRVNVNGGAVALGHAIGASGARVLTTLLYALRDRGLKRGIATLCLGGGNGVALAVERA